MWRKECKGTFVKMPRDFPKLNADQAKGFCRDCREFQSQSRTRCVCNPLWCEVAGPIHLVTEGIAPCVCLARMALGAEESQQQETNDTKAVALYIHLERGHSRIRPFFLPGSSFFSQR